ncbi:MAG: SH3 domain-containing protein, partial [bacterium]|nr:SH3 domain-containing protein [bacterium]
MSRSLRSFGIFPVIFLLVFIGLLSGGIFIDPASANEMETSLNGPRSDSPDTAVSVDSGPAEQKPAVAWWQSAIQGISSFFRSLFGGGNDTLQKGSVTSTVGLTVRSGAGSFNRNIGSLPYGTEVTIVGERSGWYKIEYQDRKAWISSRYVSVAGSAQKPKTVKLPREALPPSTIAGY